MKADPGRLESEDYLLLSAVLGLPWLFGGTEIWAYRAAALPLVAGAVVALIRRGWAGLGLEGRKSVWLLPAFLLAVWALVQALPLPGPVHRLLSPESYAWYAATEPDRSLPPDQVARAFEEQALARVPEVQGMPLPEEREPLVVPAAPCGSARRALSLHPSGTWERLAWYLALLLGFLTVRARVASPARFAAYRAALFALFVALAVFALVQAQTWNDKIYWVRPVGVGRRPFGPYINPGHFAGVMELAIPWLVASAIHSFRQGGRAVAREARAVMLCVGSLACLLAGLAASSKMAVVLFAGALVAVALRAASSWASRLVVSVTVIVVLAALGLTLSGTHLGERVGSFVDRLDSSVPLEGRWAAWKASIDLVQAFPVTGSGFGSFGEVFISYMPPGGVRRWTKAHNDYLQVLLEGGLVALGLLLWLIVAYWSRVLRALRATSGRRAMDALPRLGLVLGLVSLSLHAFVDFNHQIPANALLFVVLAAMALPVETERPRESS